mgnify:CR=1 FL=1
MRNILSALLLLTVSSFLLYIFLVQRTVRKTVKISLPALKVSQQLTDPANLVKWYMPFANTALQPDIQYNDNNNIIRSGNDSIEITNQSIYSTLLKTFSGRQKKYFHFSVIPDTTRQEQAVVTMTYKTSLFKQWFNKGNLEKNALQSLTNFKEYMEDTKRFYGFEIQPVTVTDTLFLFIAETVALSEKRNATRKLFEQLIAYAEKNKAGYNGVRIFYSQKTGDDKITLFASIGVTNRINIPPADPFEQKMMPAGKNLLEATYQGPFGESDKAVQALESFKTDHNLSSMAIPFKKFLSDGYDFTDDQIVQLKVYYPIF